MRAAVDDVALVPGEEVEVDVAEGAVGAPVRLLDVVPVRARPEVLPAAVVAGALDVGDGVGRVLRPRAGGADLGFNSRISRIRLKTGPKLPHDVGRFKPK